MLDAVTAPQRTTLAKTKTSAAAPQSGARRLVRWHRTALGLLAVLSVAGQGAMQIALRAPQADVPAIAQAGRQQTLSQHLVLSALAVQASETPTQRMAWETDLRDTADLWKLSAETLPRSSPAASARLAAAAPSQEAMLDAAQSLLAALPPDTSRQKTDLSPYLASLFQNQKLYDASMDAVTTEYWGEAAAHLCVLRGTQAGLCVVTLLALAALGLLSSQPQAGAVCRTIAALDALEQKKREQDAALSEADRQIAQMRQTLENLSTVDALTGLQNHRAFQEQLDRELGRALRHGQALSLLLLDIDQFKSYNNSYGHTEGDQALKVVSELLQETARASDIPARYGGKEFAIILTDTDMMGAVVLGERLRQAVASADGLQRPLTASIGIATLNSNIFSVAALIAQADRALCHAKGDGRNRVSHAHRIPSPLEDEAPVYAQAA